MSQNNLPGIKHISTSNRGKKFEADLDSVNDYYRLRGIVDVVKNAELWEYSDKLKFLTADKYLAAKGNPPTVAVTGDDWVITKAVSDVDYSGGNQTGSYIFDAKEAANDYIAFDRLKPSQIGRLYQSSKCGVIAGFLIHFKASDRVFFAPVQYVRNKEQIKLKQSGKRAASGTARITVNELIENGHEIFRDPKNGLWKWYEVLSKLKEEKC
ncbi:MAG TPA: Holliday junction resolvase RecU [Pyrinomonadaceae bacterium]|jgi:penicillin-binding protein-related factor A (putative recombinase)